METSPVQSTRVQQPFDPRRIERPHSSLWKYYLLVSVLSGPLFPLVFVPLLFKYETLKYRFRDDGVSMSWGILFRREVHLTYRRIQDIHLTRNLIQRWLGLATVSIQTASGSAMPEMSIEGIPEADLLRDFLYEHMRGAVAAGHDATSTPEQATSVAPPADESLALLTEIRDLLRQLARRRGGES